MGCPKKCMVKGKGGRGGFAASTRGPNSLVVLGFESKLLVW